MKCEHQHCYEEAVRTVAWKSDRFRSYCREHAERARARGALTMEQFERLEEYKAAA